MPLSNSRSIRTAAARAFVLAVLPFGCTVARAAEAPSTGKPRVALVLSGGGALGLAHVGAIREFERLGIRPDIVVGTSMGAVVGGLYASGLDGAALERVVRTVDWKAVLNPRPDRDRLTFRQKVQQADFPVRTSLALKDGALQLPGGLISDRVLLQELRRFAGVGGVTGRFDDLAIPFRAVATDIETGGVVVLDRGELSMAMRASMAVPGVFAPVAIDGRLLVDGGMAANVPIAVARELGADIVIAVTFRSDLLKQKDIVSALDVLGQTVSLLIIANERASLATLASTDILVEIDTRGFSTGDFTRGAELIEVGRKGIEPQAERLAALAAARGRATYVQPATAISPVIDYVRIDNSSRLNDAVVARKLDGLIGRAANPAQINTALDGIYALGPFERVDFAIETVGDRTGLLVRAEDSVPEAGRIRLGLTVSNNFSDDSDYAVSFDYRTAALDRFGSELQIQATVGDRNILSAEYFKLLEPRQRWFAAGRVEFQNRKVDLYEERGFKRAEYQLNYGLAALDVGYQFGSFAELRIGIERGGGRAKLVTGVAEPGEIDIRIGRLAARAGLDTLDDPFFPRRGTRGTARWTRGFRELGDRSDFQTVAGSALVALSADRHTAILGVSGGSNIAGTTPVESMFRLGGLFNFSGYRQDELTGEAFGIGRAVYRYTLTDTAKKLFGATLYLGASIEAGNVWARREDAGFADLRYAGSVYVAADTGLGPIFLAYGRATGGRQSVYLFIGRPF